MPRCLYCTGREVRFKLNKKGAGVSDEEEYPHSMLRGSSHEMLL